MHGKQKKGERSMERKTMGTQAGVLITILGGALWGLSGACGQYLFEYKGVTSGWLVPIRLTMAGLTMLLYYIFKERGVAFRIWKKGRDAAEVMIYGIAGLMLCQYTYFVTIELSNAGTATVIQYLSPVLIMVLVCFMEKRLPRAVEVLSLILAISGIFLIATHGNVHQMVISREALVMGLLSAATVVLYNMQPPAAHGLLSHSIPSGLGNDHRRDRPGPGLSAMEIPLYPGSPLSSSPGGHYLSGVHGGLYPVYAGGKAHRPGPGQSLRLCGAHCGHAAVGCVAEGAV